MKAAGWLICMAMCTRIFGAAYYVDFEAGSDSNAGTSKTAPWKLCPGMPGFAGKYTHKAGDVFTFKGGVTWPRAALPLRIGYSGEAGHMDVYGGEDQTWHTGDSWTRPIFDGEQAWGSAYGLVGTDTVPQSYVKLDDVEVKNSGYVVLGTDTGGTGSRLVLTDATKAWRSNQWKKYSAYNTSDGSKCEIASNTATTVTCTATLEGGRNNLWSKRDSYILTDGDGTAIGFIGGGNIEISNNTLLPHSLQSVAYSSSSLSTAHIYIHGNDISYAGRMVIYGAFGTTVDDVQVYGNRMQGSGGTPLGSYHLDGLMIGNGDGGCLKHGPPFKPTVTNIKFYGNYLYGDWPGGPTALYYSCSCTNYTTIYNNVFALETVDPNYIGYIMRWAYSDGNISVYNNTISSDGNPGFAKGASGAIQLDEYASTPGYGTLIIKGNIISGFGLDIAGITVSQWRSIDIDDNLHYPSPAGGRHHIFSIGAVDCDTLDCAKEHWAFEEHSPAMAAPLFVAVPNGKAGSGDYHLRASSPAKSKGINLYLVFTTDADGRPRPRTGAWDLGAFVAGSSQDAAQ
jgi:hypothetical protein